jgi:hypothetical protein
VFNMLYKETKNWWLGLSNDTRINITMCLTMWCIVSFIVGVINARTDSPRRVCDYDSIISVINPPYILGCELFGARLREKAGEE